jgi:hypothetical protein
MSATNLFQFTNSFVLLGWILLLAAPLCKTYPNLDRVVFASCFNMLPKLTLSVGVNTPQADTV